MDSILNNFDAAKQLVGKPQSSLVLLSHVLHTPMPCEYLSDIVKAIMVVLKDELEIYSPDMHGVPVAFDEKSVKLLEKHGKIIGAQSYVHCDIKCDFVVFQPKIGQILHGIVNKVASNNVGCLIHGCFYATINFRSQNAINMYSNIEIGDEISLKVSKLEEDGNGVLSIIGVPLKSRSKLNKSNLNDVQSSDTATTLIHSPDSGIITNDTTSSFFPAHNDQKSELETSILIDDLKKKKHKKAKKVKKNKKIKKENINESDASTTLSESFTEEKSRTKKKKKKDKKLKKKKKEKSSEGNNENIPRISPELSMPNFEFDNLPSFSPQKPGSEPAILLTTTSATTTSIGITSPKKKMNVKEEKIDSIVESNSALEKQTKQKTSGKTNKRIKNNTEKVSNNLQENIEQLSTSSIEPVSLPENVLPTIPVGKYELSRAEEDVLKSLDLGNVLHWKDESSSINTLSTVEVTNSASKKSKTKKRKLGASEALLSPPSKKTLLDNDVDVLPPSMLSGNEHNESTLDSEMSEHQKQALYHLQKLGINVPISSLLSTTNTSLNITASATNSNSQNFVAPSVVPKSAKSKKNKSAKKSKLDSVSTFSSFNPAETSTPMLSILSESTSKPGIFAYKTMTKQEVANPEILEKSANPKGLIIKDRNNDLHQLALLQNEQADKQEVKSKKKKKKGKTEENSSIIAEASNIMLTQLEEVVSDQKSKKKKKKKKKSLEPSKDGIQSSNDTLLEQHSFTQDTVLSVPPHGITTPNKTAEENNKDSSCDTLKISSEYPTPVQSMNKTKLEASFNGTTNSLKRKKEKNKKHEKGEKSKKKHKKEKKLKQENA